MESNKGKFLHEQTVKSQKDRRITLSLTAALDGGGWLNHAPVALPARITGIRCTGGWVGSRAGLDGAENLAPTGIRSPDRPACSELLYRLSYPGPPMELEVDYHLFGPYRNEICGCSSKDDCWCCQARSLYSSWYSFQLIHFCTFVCFHGFFGHGFYLLL